MIYEGKLNGSGLKIGIVAARFNEFIVSKLVSGAEDCLYRHDVAKEDVEVAWVPGAFEIPLVAQAMARTKNGKTCGNRNTIRRITINERRV